METLGLKITDILIWEATSKTRIEVPATKDLKAGQLVDYPLRGQKLVALTDEKDGKVQVQPHNCIINLAYSSAAEIQAAFGNLSLIPRPDGGMTASGSSTTIDKAGDPYGIVYRGTPKS